MWYLDNKYSTIEIDNITVTNSEAATSGGVFYVDNQQTLNIKDSTFNELKATEEGSLMYSISTNLTLNINYTLTSCNTNAYDYATDLLGKIDISLPTATQAGAFYISGAKQITTLNHTLQNCYLCTKGAGFSLISTKLTDTLSTYSWNAAHSGGVFYLDSSTLLLTSASFNQNYAVQGGVIHVY